MPKKSAAVRSHPALDQTRLIKMVGYNLRRAYLMVSRKFAGPMARADLRPAEFAVLALLRDNAGSSQRSVASALAIDPPNMANLLDRLEKRNLVQRPRNPDDERARQLALTPDGLSLIQRTYEAVERQEKRALGVLTTQEQNQLMTLLRKLIAADLDQER